MDWREKLKAIEHVPVTLELRCYLDYILPPVAGFCQPFYILTADYYSHWQYFVRSMVDWRVSRGGTQPEEFYLNELAHFLVHGTDFSELPEMADLKFATAVEICREAFGWEK